MSNLGPNRGPANLADYHVHIEKGPYRRPWLDRFVRRAAARGLAELGVSEHLYRFKQAAGLLNNSWENRRRTQDLDRYFALLEEARAGGPDDQRDGPDDQRDGLAVPLRIGIEFDYVPETEEAIGRLLDRYPFDYRIGSVHWLGDVGFDLGPDIPFWKNGDIRRNYADYFAMLSRLARSGLADIVGHPDVIKVFGHRPPDGADDARRAGEADTAAFLRPLYDRAAEEFAAAELAAEVSTAGLRKPVGEMYPAPAFLAALRAHGVPIVISSDAHRPGDVGRDFETAVTFARAAGYREVVRFAGRRGTAFPFYRPKADSN
ncbi:MAG: histidinol-phosphatase [Bacillota bacterium]